MSRDKIVTIGITEKTKTKIERLAKIKHLTQVTILEYLLSGKINLEELYEKINLGKIY